MSDKKSVPLAAAEQAVRIVEIEGVLQLQAQSVRTAVENMSNTLASVQADVRRSAEEVHKLALSHASNEADRQAIARLESNFVELSRRLEDYFNDRDKIDDQRWQAHERATEEYRIRREAEIENDFRDTRRDVTAIEKRMTLWYGIVIGGSILASSVVGGFLWTLNNRFESNNDSIRTLESRSEANRERFELVKDKQHAMELYLARMGYQPSTQEEPK